MISTIRSAAAVCLIASAPIASVPLVAKGSIEELATSASDIAIVEVTRRVALEYEYAEERRICGYRVAARVIESFKGAARSLEFIDPLDGEPGEARNKYLVFSFEQMNSVDEAAPPGSLYEAESRCFVSGGARVLRARPRSMLRVIEHADERWVLVPIESGVEVDSFRRIATAGEELPKGSLVAWEDIRGEIDGALERLRGHERGGTSSPE
jgi:hypothetical protein